MLKIFVTGDNHFGKKYDRYPEVKEKLIQSRFDCMKDMVKQADKEGCGLFVVTGDLFDNINSIKSGDIKQVVEILKGFSGTVLVLPGNHDYYTGEEKVWKDFEKHLSESDHRITILNEYKAYHFEVGEDKVVVYPAFCQSKHSKENNLTWIKEADMQSNFSYNIGIAHGAIKGITPDMKEEYFLMTEKELQDISVDAWLIGHTHIQYPELKENDEETRYKIFNAGTHEQTDLHNKTEGCCFIITIDKRSEKKIIAHKYVSGKINYYDLMINLNPYSENSLKDSLENEVKLISKNSVIRAKISGTIKQSEYEVKDIIYKDILGSFLTYECEDNELSEEITIEKIRKEFSEISFAAKFMEHLMDNPIELQMTYELLKNCEG